MRIIFLLFFLTSISLSFAQNPKNTNELRDLTKLDLGLQGIGFTFEPRISNKATMDLSVGSGGGYNVSEERILYKWNLFHPAFYFSATPKWYYNREKRIQAGKNSEYNSGNYIGLRLKFVTGAFGLIDYNRNSLLINAHWGLQRAIGDRLTINAHAGAGYAQDVDAKYGTIYPSVDFKFSYILSRPKI